MYVCMYVYIGLWRDLLLSNQYNKLPLHLILPEACI